MKSATMPGVLNNNKLTPKEFIGISKKPKNEKPCLMSYKQKTK